MRLAGMGAAPSMLVRFDLYTSNEKKSYPVLISKAIFGVDLLTRWSAVRANPTYTWTLISSILFRPGDGRFLNYILDNDQNIICTNNSCSFVEPLSKGILSDTIHFCAAPFSVLPLGTVLDQETIQQFVSLDTHAILSEWLTDVVAKEKEYSGLFPNAEGDFTTKIMLPEGTLSLLYLQFFSLQKKLAALLEKNRAVTSGDLLKALFSLSDESVGQTIFNAYNNHRLIANPHDRFKKAVSRSIVSPMTPKEYFKVLPTQPEKEKIFSVQEARCELQFACFNEKSIKANFIFFVDDHTRELKALQALLRTSGSNTTLTISHSHVLTSSLLEAFLHQDIEFIELDCCNLIDDKIIVLIQKKCPQLKRLSLRDCPGLTLINGSFPSLEELDLSGSIKCEDHKLLLQVIRKNAKGFNSSSDNLKKSRAYVLEAIKLNSKVFQFIESKFSMDENFVMDAVLINPEVMQYVDSSFGTNAEFVLKVIVYNINVLKYTLNVVKGNKVLILDAVKLSSWAIHYAVIELQTDRPFLVQAIVQNPEVYCRIDVSISKDEEFQIEACAGNHHVLKYFDPQLLLNNKFLLKAIKSNAKFFTYVNESVKFERRFIFDAIAENLEVIAYLPDKYAKDRGMILGEIKMNAKALLYTQHFKKDKKFVLDAIGLNPEAILYIDTCFKDDKDIARLVEEDEEIASIVKQHQLALERKKVLASFDQFSIGFFEENSIINSFPKEILIHILAFGRLLEMMNSLTIQQPSEHSKTKKRHNIYDISSD